MLAAFITTILFSLSAVSGRRLAHHLSGTQANLLRLMVAATVLGLWSHLFGFGITSKAFPLLFMSGCVGFGMGDLAMLQAFPRIGTRRTMVLVQCLAAPFAALSRKAYAVAASAGETFHGVGDGVNAAYQRLLGGLVAVAGGLGLTLT